MREHLDCAALVTPFDEQAGQLQGSYAGGRLVVHLLASGAAGDASRTLLQAAMPLRRYDVCLLRVSPASLSWARTNLQAARPALATPIVAITQGLKAAALDDLHALGVGDFLREPFCAEELRARCQRLLARQPRLYAVAAVSSVEPGTVRLGESSRQYGAEPVGRKADALGADVLPLTALESYAMAAAAGGDDTGASLRSAKTQLVARFETAYIKAALHRHRGNIAMAARSVQKHRRAFWALMHKYQIDPAPYRAAGRPGGKTRRPGKMPANFSEG